MQACMSIENSCIYNGTSVFQIISLPNPENDCSIRTVSVLFKVVENVSA